MTRKSAFWALVLLAVATMTVVAILGQPRSARALGIAGMSQYELTRKVLNAADDVVSHQLRGEPRQAKRMLGSVKQWARFIDEQSEWVSLRYVVADMVTTMNGADTGLTWEEIRKRLDEFSFRIYPSSSSGIDTLPELDKRYRDFLYIPTTFREMGMTHYDNTSVAETLKTLGEDENEALNRLRRARRIYRASKDPSPFFCARASLLSVKADKMYIQEQIRRLPPQQDRLDVQDEMEILKQAEKSLRDRRYYQIILSNARGTKLYREPEG